MASVGRTMAYVHRNLSASGLMVTLTGSSPARAPETGPARAIPQARTGGRSDTRNMTTLRDGSARIVRGGETEHPDGPKWCPIPAEVSTAVCGGRPRAGRYPRLQGESRPGSEEEGE